MTVPQRKSKSTNFLVACFQARQLASRWVCVPWPRTALLPMCVAQGSHRAGHPYDHSCPSHASRRPAGLSHTTAAFLSNGHLASTVRSAQAARPPRLSPVIMSTAAAVMAAANFIARSGRPVITAC